MKATKVFTMIDDIIKKIQKSDDIKSSEAQKMIVKLTELSQIYREIEIEKDYMEVYDALKHKGEWLKSQFCAKKSSGKISKEINHYIRLLKASLADFRKESGKLIQFYRLFILMCVLLLVLAPKLYGSVISLMLIIPVFGSLRAIKNRQRSGVYLCGIIIPLSLVTGINWLKAGAGFFSILGAITSIFAIFMIYKIYKIKDMFV